MTPHNDLPKNPSPLLDCVKRLQKGDESAMNQICELTKEPLYKACYQLTGDFNLAQELAQETYIKVFTQVKKTSGFETPSKFLSWLHTIARNEFLMSKRKSSEKVAGHKEKTYDDDRTDLIQRIPEVAPSDLENILSIQKALAQLPEKDRVLLLLVDYEEYSYAEAAKAVGISEKNVSFRIHHARKRFLEAYEQKHK